VGPAVKQQDNEEKGQNEKELRQDYTKKVRAIELKAQNQHEASNERDQQNTV
jgi:hypothetical protein